jgi:hypothetical protein
MTVFRSLSLSPPDPYPVSANLVQRREYSTFTQVYLCIQILRLPTLFVIWPPVTFRTLLTTRSMVPSLSYPYPAYTNGNENKKERKKTGRPDTSVFSTLNYDMIAGSYHLSSLSVVPLE